MAKGGFFTIPQVKPSTLLRTGFVVSPARKISKRTAHSCAWRYSEPTSPGVHACPERHDLWMMRQRTQMLVEGAIQTTPALVACEAWFRNRIELNVHALTLSCFSGKKRVREVHSIIKIIVIRAKGTKRCYTHNSIRDVNIVWLYTM